MLLWTKVPLPKTKFIVEYSILDFLTILKFSHAQLAEKPMIARPPYARIIRRQETC